MSASEEPEPEPVASGFDLTEEEKVYLFSEDNAVLTDQTKNPDRTPKGKRHRYFKGGKITPGQANGGETGRINRKRPSSHTAPSESKISKLTGKTATAVVNEKYPGLEYQFDDVIGPAHEPCFTVRVLFPQSNKEYIAIGASKKMAKNNVAQKILKDLGIDFVAVEVEKKNTGPSSYNFQKVARTAPQLQDISKSKVQDLNVSSDKIIMSGDFGDSIQKTVEESPAVLLSNLTMDRKLLQRIRNIQNLEERANLAISCLAYPSQAEYEEVSSDGPPHNKVFVYKLTVMSLTTYGRGTSKKKAKADAARQALVELFGPSIFEFVSSNGEDEQGFILQDVQISAKSDVHTDTTNLKMAHQMNRDLDNDKPERDTQKGLAGIEQNLLDPSRVEITAIEPEPSKEANLMLEGLTGNDSSSDNLTSRMADLMNNNSNYVAQMGLEKLEATQDLLLDQSQSQVVITATETEPNKEKNFMLDVGPPPNAHHTDILATSVLQKHEKNPFTPVDSAIGLYSSGMNVYNCHEERRLYNQTNVSAGAEWFWKPLIMRKVESPSCSYSGRSAHNGSDDLKRRFSYSRNFVKETHAVEVNYAGEKVVRIRRPVQDKSEFIPDSKSVGMMKRMGWAPGYGLGKNNHGRRHALECSPVKLGNYGLGFGKT